MVYGINGWVSVVAPPSVIVPNITQGKKKLYLNGTAQLPYSWMSRYPRLAADS